VAGKLAEVSISAASCEEMLSPSDAADNGLKSPAMNVMNLVDFPEQEWSIAPSPEELPYDGWKPSSIST
jgi:hypothetical protein